MKKLISVLLAVMLIFGTQAAFAYDLNQNADFEPQTIRDGLIISVPTYTMVKADGSEAASFTTLDPYGGATVTAHVLAKDYKTASSNVQVIVALYDAQNNLVKTATQSATLSATLGAETEIPVSITLPDDISTGCYLKTMVWTDMNSTLTPYVQSFTFPGGIVDSDWELDGWKIVADKETSDNGVYTNEFSALKSTAKDATATKTFKVEPGSVSAVVFMAKGDRNNGSIVCKVTGKDGTELTSYTVKGDDETINRFRGWFNYYTIPFNAGENDEVTVKFVNGANYDAYIDDVSVTDNLIVNGDFNSNTAYGKYAPYWQRINTNEAYRFEIDNSDKIEGKSSLKITTTANGNSLDQVIRSSIIEKAGTGTYVLSGFFKRDKLNANGAKGTKFFPQIKKTDKTYLLQYETNITNLYNNKGVTDTTDWHYFSTEVNINTVEDITLSLYFAGNYEETTIHIDDLRLVKKNNLLTNADFETGLDSKGKVVNWAMSSGSATVAIDNDVVYAGKNSVKVSGRGATAEAVAQSVADALNQNGAGLYVVSGWFKTTNGGTPCINLRIAYKENAEATSNKLYDTYTRGVSGNDDWQYVSGIIEVPQNCVDIISWARVQLYVGAGTGTDAGDFYADNVRFFKIADLPAEVTE